MKRILLGLFCLFLTLEGCHYTARSVEGRRVSAAQAQEIKLGKTTEMDLLSLLGPPSKKERKADGSEVLQYTHSQIESLTFPGGFVMHGLLDREGGEIFEIILKDGVVQSFHFSQQP